MSKQMAQMQSLMNSMPAEMRRQLEDMMEACCRTTGSHGTCSRLATNLERMNPGRSKTTTSGCSATNPSPFSKPSS